MPDISLKHIMREGLCIAYMLLIFPFFFVGVLLLATVAHISDWIEKK